MKYEAVFGDYKFSSPACEVAMQSSFGEIIEMGFTKPLVIPEGWGVIAMRRIIPEPKRWTVEDKKAGRLPEVGCDIQYIESQKRVSVIAINSNEIVLLAKSNGSKFFVLDPDSLLQYYNPVETPEEKAQREEDEFVFLVESEYNKMPNEISFKAGIRAAYRKLKGGE